MARDEGAPEGGRREYLYSKCATCHMKVNISAHVCPRCKNRVSWNANKAEWEVQVVYGSHNSEDWIYGQQLCGTERCMVCEKALLGNPCRYAYCYGTGRGRCALCERFEAERYSCCQERQRENAAIWGSIQSDPAGGGGKDG
jgi:hypothetical protein